MLPRVRYGRTSGFWGGVLAAMQPPNPQFWCLNGILPSSWITASLIIILIWFCGSPILIHLNYLGSEQKQCLHDTLLDMYSFIRTARVWKINDNDHLFGCLQLEKDSSSKYMCLLTFIFFIIFYHSKNSATFAAVAIGGMARRQPFVLQVVWHTTSTESRSREGCQVLIYQSV